jgi:tetratricopeptide (TPR) repeat protein
LLQKRRKEIHGKIGKAIEQIYPERLEEFYEMLAYHFFQGEIWDKAVTYFRQAGAKAFTRSANREAVTCFEQALTALSHLPDTRERLEQAIDLRFDIRNSLQPLGQLEQIFGCLREAERLARTLNDQRRLGWTSAYMSANLWMTGHLSEARTFGQSAHAIAEMLGDFALQLVANYYLGLACLASGDYRPAENFLRRAVGALKDDLSRERFGLAGFPAVMSRSFLARSLAQRGDFNEAIVLGEEGVRIAQALDHPYSLIIGCRDLGYLYGVKGEFNHAIHVLERGLARGREGRVTLISATVMGFLGHVYARSGRVAEGLSLLEQALKARESMGAALFHSLLVVELGEACVLANRLEDALLSAGRALRLARERGERGYEAWALRLLGEIASDRNPPDVDEAEDRYRQAITLAAELGMRPLLAHCHLGLGKLYRRTGDRPKAQEHLTTATTMLREMDMRFWLEQAEAELKELG